MNIKSIMGLNVLLICNYSNTNIKTNKINEAKIVLKIRTYFSQYIIEFKISWQNQVQVIDFFLRSTFGEQCQVQIHRIHL